MLMHSWHCMGHAGNLGVAQKFMTTERDTTTIDAVAARLPPSESEDVLFPVVAATVVFPLRAVVVGELISSGSVPDFEVDTGMVTSSAAIVVVPFSAAMEEPQTNNKSATARII